MSASTEAEVILYDLANVKDVCFSPSVWRIRLILNYKGITYKTVFLEFPHIEPTFQGLEIEANQSGNVKYTVPAIHHIASNTYIMDSVKIAPFLESQYPTPPFVLASDIGTEIASRARASLWKAIRISIQSREASILSPKSEVYFRAKHEPALGHKMEDLRADGKEEEVWAEAHAELEAIGDMIRSRNEGQFIDGRNPGSTDFFLVGVMQCARAVHEPTWARIVKVKGFNQLYQACAGWLEKNN